MVFNNAVGSEVAEEMFCPLTRSACRSDCALLQYHLHVDEKNDVVRRHFACGFAVNESLYWEPAYAMQSNKMSDEFKESANGNA